MYKSYIHKTHLLIIDIQNCPANKFLQLFTVSSKIEAAKTDICSNQHNRNYHSARTLIGLSKKVECIIRFTIHSPQQLRLVECQMLQEHIRDNWHIRGGVFEIDFTHLTSALHQPSTVAR